MMMPIDKAKFRMIISWMHHTLEMAIRENNDTSGMPDKSTLSEPCIPKGCSIKTITNIREQIRKKPIFCALNPNPNPSPNPNPNLNPNPKLNPNPNPNEPNP